MFPSQLNLKKFQFKLDNFKWLKESVINKGNATPNPL